MKALLSKHPYFVALLPIFFVLHGYVAHAEFIAAGGIVQLLLVLLAAAGILYFLFRVMLQQPIKAGLFTLYCLGFYLFFGAFYDFLKAWSPWTLVWKYSVLLTTFLVLAIILFLFLRRSKSGMGRAAFFFNLLFLIFIGVDLLSLANKKWLKKDDNATAVTASKQKMLPGIQRPDIYLLLFDEYSASHSLKELYQFDNSGLDSFLVQQGFHLIPGSRSNYPETSFSMASCLNMDYLDWLKPGMEIRREHYQRCAEEIRNNEVMQLLSDNGYQIVNQSVFDLHHHPAPVSQRWLSIDTRLITEETLLSRLCHEFNWFFNRYALLRKILPVTSYEEQMLNNDRCLAGVLAASTVKANRPRFVYGHFLLPHFPFYKNKNGQILPDSIVNGVMQEKIAPLPHYLEYVQYTNIEVRKLVAGIRANNPQAVIIFLSDHGYRWNVPAGQLSHVFYNQNAVYLPSGQYGKFYDSITNVNQFRVIFNSLFGTQYPLLKDTSLFVQPGLIPH
jgi:hypothetical protein